MRSRSWRFGGRPGLAVLPRGSGLTDSFEGRVLSAFFHDGRLVGLPARQKKRRVVLNWLAGHFRPGERYSEAQVNDILRRYHEDVALLRRALVDHELMQRERGLYWRAGTLPYLKSH